jgi:hypothetical protein
MKTPMRNLIDAVAPLKEYQLIPPMDFLPIDFSTGHPIGKINTGAGVLEVWRLIDGDTVGYGAVDYEIGPASPLAFLVFQELPNGAFVSKNAFTVQAARNKGIQSELMLFVNKVENRTILSDTRMTPQGVALWDSISRSGKTDIRILYVPTSERFDKSEIGVAKTQDDVTVIDPKDDFHSSSFYDSSTKQGQRFFFIMETREIFETIVDGVTYTYGMSPARHRMGLIQPHRHFFDDEDQ